MRCPAATKKASPTTKLGAHEPAHNPTRQSRTVREKRDLSPRNHGSVHAAQGPQATTARAVADDAIRTRRDGLKNTGATTASPARCGKILLRPRHTQKKGWQPALERRCGQVGVGRLLSTVMEHGPTEGVGASGAETPHGIGHNQRPTEASEWGWHGGWDSMHTVPADATKTEQATSSLCNSSRNSASVECLRRTALGRAACDGRTGRSPRPLPAGLQSFPLLPHCPRPAGQAAAVCPCAAYSLRRRLAPIDHAFALRTTLTRGGGSGTVTPSRFGCVWSRPAGPSQAGEVTDRQRDYWAYPSAITAIAIRRRSVGGIHRGGPVDAEDEAPQRTAGGGWRRGVGGGQRAAGTTFCSSDDRRQRGTAPGANRRRQRHREGAAAASTR